MTENALNHRFRRLKTQTLIIRKAREQGFDIKDMTCNEAILPIAQDRVDIENIAMYFESGGNPATALDLTSTTPAATPSRGPGGRSTTKTPTSKRVRKTPGKVKPEPTSDAEDEDDYDYDSSSDREQSPSKRVKAKTETAPIRMTDLPRMSAPHSTLRSTQFSYTPAPAPAPAPAPPTESIFGFRNGGQDEFAGNGTSQLSFYGYPEAQDDGEI
ncbi:hypothetical protein VHEMI01370 [[Torrubiella] hemipterigena]|nr:hypothetical protein VHEMI01370 [[Torrubiella] hemipterigena]